MNRLISIVVPATALILGSTAAAFAHAHLLSAVPPMGAPAAQAPAELVLHFSEGVNLAFTGLTLTDAHKTVVPLGSATLGSGGDAKTLVVPSGAPLSPGLYEVAWHALATDGHKTNGVYVFTVRP